MGSNNIFKPLTTFLKPATLIILWSEFIKYFCFGWKNWLMRPKTSLMIGAVNNNNPDDVIPIFFSEWLSSNEDEWVFGNALLFWKPLRASSHFTAVEKSSEVIFVDGFLKATNFHLCWLLIWQPLAQGHFARRSIALIPKWNMTF